MKYASDIQKKELKRKTLKCKCKIFKNLQKENENDRQAIAVKAIFYWFVFLIFSHSNVDYYSNCILVVNYSMINYSFYTDFISYHTVCGFMLITQLDL